MDFHPCADQSIGSFVASLEGYGPKWYDLVPCDDTSGWGASAPDWRNQASGIIDDFEKCARVHIDFVPNEIDQLGQMPLSDFAEYLVEKAEESSANLLARSATQLLQSIQVRHQQNGVLVRTNMRAPS